MFLPILKLGNALIVPLPETLTDSEWNQLRDAVLSKLGVHRSRAVIVDVSAMDVMDSYATRVLDGLARMVSLRGARMVVVGVSPMVAYAMTQLGLKLSSAMTAVDLDEAMAALESAPGSVEHGG